MRKNLKKHIIFLILCVALITILYNIPYELINYPNNMLVTLSELNNLQDKYKNSLITSKVIAYANNEEKEKKLNEYTVKFKLFNLVNIKNLKVKLPNENVVLLGGQCIGISLKSKGAVVVGSNYIITKNGNISPFKNSNLQIGDLITHMNGIEINNMQDISNVLKNYKDGEEIKLNVIRKEQHLEITIKPVLDIQTNTYKLGLWIRDDAVGVGTLTFINPNLNNRFGSLGHAIIDSDTKVKFNVNNGEIYNCNVIGVKKGIKRKPGELLGLFMYGNENKLGIVEKNCDHGVYGVITNKEFLFDKKEMEVGGRITAKPGKAKIRTCLNGQQVEEFDIEIIKTNYQTKPNEKSMVIKITDPRLINKSGGIVQGMSGSPIIQNGKIIGAVTHVFINDPTKGFGLYLDWMLVE